MVKCSNGNPDCRSFKVLGSGIDFQGGRYIAESRSMAAKRAGSKLFERVHNDPEYKKYAYKNSIKFILGETTHRSNRNTMAYQVTKHKLSKPKQIKKGSVVINVRYTYTVIKLFNQDDKEISNMKIVNNPLFSP